MRFLFLILTVLLATPAFAETVVLDTTAVKNLRLETFTAEETVFEESFFALGRIEPMPDRVAVVSSRIAGRVTALSVIPGDKVKAGQSVVGVESRQPGNPPPTIELAAPLGGLVTRSDLRLGDPVEPEKALMEIIDLREVYAIARVPEHLAGRIKPGTRAIIRVAALPDQPFEGELLRFGTTADRESGTIDAIFRLPNTGGLLRPSMRAEFSIILSQRSNVLSVPRSAIQGDAGSRFVYVRHFDLPNAFIKTPVQIGEINDRFAEIISGIFPADEVVTRGAYSLSFVGSGTLSLKEALDAAHGHEHAEDGSELTPEAAAKKKGADHGHSHDHDGDHAEHGISAWAWVSAVLFILLLLSLIRRAPRAVN